MNYLILGIACFVAGVVVDELFAQRIVTAVRAEFSAIHAKVDAVLDAIKK